MKMEGNNQSTMSEQMENAALFGDKLTDLVKIAALLASGLAVMVMSACSQTEPMATTETPVHKVKVAEPVVRTQSVVNSGRVMTAKAATDPVNKETVVPYCGALTVRAVPDQSVSMPWLMTSKENCFIVMSKKDYYLYVYERRGDNCVMLARYDCAFALNCGNKQKEGDMKTPVCSDMSHPFSISQICDASNWHHDFKDGRGNILAYGDWFLRLDIGTSNRSIGIHGSTNNEVTVPGRASEGCIRLKDKDIRDLKENYARVGMKVYIKGETIGDEDFEEVALTSFNTQNPTKARKRNISPTDKLSDAARLGLNS